MSMFSTTIDTITSERNFLDYSQASQLPQVALQLYNIKLPYRFNPAARFEYWKCLEASCQL